MRLFGLKPRPLQPFPYLPGDHHGPMMPPGAAKRDRQIALPLTNIMRDQINQQLRDTFDELLGLGKGTYVSRHAGMPSRQLLKLWNIVRVRQEANVEDKIGVRRHAVAIAETRNINPNLGLIALAPEVRSDQIAQLMHVELRRVDHGIRKRPYGGDLFLFLLDAVEDGALGAERMRTARLRVAPHESGVVRLQKQQARGTKAGKNLEAFWETRKHVH